MEIQDLPKESKVWLYKSDRKLSDDEVNVAERKLDTFMHQWASHGSKLFGAAKVLNNWFVVIAVDEKQQMASGCSIDTSVHFVRELGNELNVDFFNRLKVLIEKKGEEKQIPFASLADYKDWKMYNPMVQNLEDLTSNWLIQIESSPYA